uniref:Uncharacterized protein n=1 Tax=Arundo donax TaxID=35708 RepID=A0A0A9B497_ARUDO
MTSPSGLCMHNQPRNERQVARFARLSPAVVEDLGQHKDKGAGSHETEIAAFTEKIAWIVLTDAFFILAARAMTLLYARSSSPARKSACARVPLPPCVDAETEEEDARRRKGTREAMIETTLGPGVFLPLLEAINVGFL